MSGPHQPGWSDEELIALGDLRINKKAFEANDPRGQAKPSRPTQARSNQPRSSQTRSNQSRTAQPPRNTARSQSPVRSQHTGAAPVAKQPRREQRPQPRRPRPMSAGHGQNHGRHTGAPSPDRARDFLESGLAHIDVNLRKFLPIGKGSAEPDAETLHHIRLPIHGGTIGVFSRKGGVGKTTVAAYLGLTLASLRRGNVIAVDGDDATSSLGWLMDPRASGTLDAIAHMQPLPTTPQAFAPFIGHTREGLDVIPGDDTDQPVDEATLTGVIDNLVRSYDLSIFDTGNAAAFSSGRALLNRSRVVLLVTGTSVDSVRAAERALSWLHQREDARNSQIITVLNGIPSGMHESQIANIEYLFADRCAAVARLPWDEHLAGGTKSASLDQLAKPTQQAFQQLAATTVHVLARTMSRPKGRAVHV